MEQGEFGLNQKTEGQDIMSFMAQLLEKNEKQEIEIERGKLSVAILKQMSNRSRLLLDAKKFELKVKEVYNAQRTYPTIPDTPQH